MRPSIIEVDQKNATQSLYSIDSRVTMYDWPTSPRNSAPSTFMVAAK